VSTAELGHIAQFDLDYALEDFQGDTRPDSIFLSERLETVLLREGVVPGGRTLDVASGTGQLAAKIQERGGHAVGIDPSSEMLGISRWLTSDAFPVTRGIAESLPFATGTFDRVICRCSLDHFVDPQHFMHEAARVLKPGGAVVVALANYESLSCRIGRARHWAARRFLHREENGDRPYFTPPPDHFHKGDVRFVRALGNGDLRLERCRGISMLWLSYNWGDMLARLPRPMSRAMLSALDRFASRAPGLADVIVAVWRPKQPTG
jgi:SAM-dependent methyltransferase